MTKKTNLLFCVLLSALLFAACSYNNHNLFYSNSLNEELCLFIDTTRIEGANNYYQVNIGLNTLGAKITFVHSSSNPYGSVYWYSHSEPQYIGYHILEKDTVRVYASPPKVSHVIRLSTLKINNKEFSPHPVNGSRILRTKSICFQLINNSIEVIKDRSMWLQPKFYSLIESNLEVPKQKLIILKRPHYFELLLDDVITFGTWKNTAEKQIEFIPIKTLYYSPICNDFVDINNEFDGLKNGLSHRIMHTTKYRIDQDSLIPLLSQDMQEDGFFWLSD